MPGLSCNNSGIKINADNGQSSEQLTCPQCSKLLTTSDTPDRIIFRCKICGQKMAVAINKVGKTGNCPKCKSPLVIPGLIEDPSNNNEDAEESEEANQKLILHLIIGIGIIVPLMIILITITVLSSGSSLNPIDMLRQIPGPIFLLVFLGLTVVCIVIGWFCGNADMTNRYPLPDLTRLDPYAIAVLRGGEAAVMQAIVLNLLNQKLVKITLLEGEGRWSKKEFEIVNVPSPKRILTPIEEEVYQFLEMSKKTSELFESSIYLKIKVHLESEYDELEDLHLAEFGTNEMRGWIIAAIMALIIGIVGGTKLYLGITNNKPVLFLMVLLPISLFLTIVALEPRERIKVPTRLGRRYLKELRRNFQWLKEPDVVKSKSVGIAPAFSTALFGVGAVASASVFAGLGKALMSAPVQDGGFWNKVRDFFRIDYTRTWGEGLFGSGCGGGGCSGGCGGGCGGCGGGGGCGRCGG